MGIDGLTFDIAANSNDVIRINVRGNKPFLNRSSAVLDRKKKDFSSLSSSFDLNEFNCKFDNTKGQFLLSDQKEKLTFDVNMKQGRVVFKTNRKMHYYGLGEHYTRLCLNDYELENWNIDVLALQKLHNAIQKNYHTSIPFFVATQEEDFIGVFIDTSFKTGFRFVDNIVEVEIDNEAFDIYLFLEKKAAAIVEKFSDLTGRIKLPERKFLGYQQCRWSYKNRAELLATAQRFREENIPCDVLYLDIDYMDKFKVFTVNNTAYGEIKDLVDEVKKLGFELVVIIDPGVKVESKYHVYEQGLENKYFIFQKDDIPYEGYVWPGKSVFPDFVQEDVRLWWGDLHSFLIDNGIRGIWNDMNEISDFSTETKTIPVDVMHRDDNGEEVRQDEIHNVYGHLEAKATWDGLKRNGLHRPFILTRAASAGTQRYAAIWCGDNHSLWEHLEASIPMNLNLGLSGMVFCGSDVGGFNGDTEPELMLRWMQLGLFYPLFRNHSAINTKHQEPWCFEDFWKTKIIKAIKLRYHLMPYIYSLFYNSSRSGEPIMRPLFYDCPDNGESYLIDDQFMMGPFLLAAPILKKNMIKRSVFLPNGIWYDFFTNQQYEGGQWILLDAVLDKIPLFVKSGAIIPVDASYGKNGIDNPTIIVQYWPGDGEFQFYDDDGKSADDEQNRSNIIRYSVEDRELLDFVIKKGYRNSDYPVKCMA